MRNRVSVIAFTLAASSWLLPTAVADEYRWDGVPGVVALSDIHGAHDAFRETLAQAGVLDDDARWSAGERHLVITGDLLDRGPDSRAAMDLLMRLEGEAAAAGGRVHVLLGNHEIMNLLGDLRYVAPGEYTAFAAEESAEERAQWFERYAARAEAGTDPAALAARFERAHPPGFFAHREAFRPDGAYGAWLLGKPLVIAINGTLFVHGGLAPAAAGRGLAALNREYGEEIASYATAVARLVDAGLLLPGDGLYAHRGVLSALPDEAEHDDDVEGAILRVMRAPEPSIHDDDSPVWYRGHAGCPAISERARIGEALAALDGERLVIGHTPTVNRRIVERLDARVIEIDTGMLADYYGGRGHALLLGEPPPSVIDQAGGRPPLETDPRPNGAAVLRVADIERLLADGTVTLGERAADGSWPAEVMLDEQTLGARFYPARSRRGSPEIAAWRLDRLLGLGLVPVTVAREVDGRKGALQFRPHGSLTEAERAAAQAGGAAWCPLAVQWDDMYVFDALVGNGARSPQQIRYDRETFRLFLTGNDEAFATSRERPSWLRDVELDVDTAWRDALTALDDAKLAAALGDTISTRQRRALLARRDDLLATKTTDAP